MSPCHRDGDLVMTFANCLIGRQVAPAESRAAAQNEHWQVAPGAPARHTISKKGHNILNKFVDMKLNDFPLKEDF